MNRTEILKWQEIESEIQYGLSWKQIYELAETTHEEFWKGFYKFVTEIYFFAGTLNDLKHKVINQRLDAKAATPSARDIKMTMNSELRILSGLSNDSFTYCI